MVGSGVISILRNATYLTAARALQPVFRTVYVVVLARHFGPEIYGLYSYAQSWYLTILSVTGFGIGAILARNIGANRGEGTGLVARTLAFKIIILFCASVVCALTGWFLEDNETAQRMLWLLSIALFARGLAQWAEMVFNAYEANRYTLVTSALFRPLEVGLAIAVIVAGGDIVAVVVVHTASWCGQAVFAMLVIARRLTTLRVDWNRAGLVEMFIANLPLALLPPLVSWLAQGPLIIYRYTNGTDAALGQAALALHAMTIIGIVPGSIAAVAQPVLSRAVQRRDGKDRWFLSVMVRLGFIAGGLAGIGALAFAAPVIVLVLGEAFDEVAQLIGPSIWIVIALVIGNQCMSVLVARGQFFKCTLAAGAAAAAITVAAIVAIKTVGGAGAILIAVAVGYAVLAITTYVFASSGGGWELFDKALLRPSLTVLAALGVYLALAQVNVVVAFVGGVLVLIGAIVVLRMFDWQLLITLLRRRKAP